MEKLYSVIELRDGAHIRVMRVPYQGRVIYHIREFYKSATPTGSAEFKPGRGIALKPEHVERVILGLQLAQEDIDAGNV